MADFDESAAGGQRGLCAFASVPTGMAPTALVAELAGFTRNAKSGAARSWLVCIWGVSFAWGSDRVVPDPTGHRGVGLFLLVGALTVYLALIALAVDIARSMYSPTKLQADSAVS